MYGFIDPALISLDVWKKSNRGIALSNGLQQAIPQQMFLRCIILGKFWDKQLFRYKLYIRAIEY